MVASDGTFSRGAAGECGALRIWACRAIIDHGGQSRSCPQRLRLKPQCAFTLHAHVGRALLSCDMCMCVRIFGAWRGDGRRLTHASDAPAAAREIRNAGAMADEVRNIGEGEGAAGKHSGFDAAALQGIPPAAAARGALAPLLLSVLSRLHDFGQNIQQRGAGIAVWVGVDGVTQEPLPHEPLPSNCFRRRLSRIVIYIKK